MAFVKEPYDINLDELSKVLAAMDIKNLFVNINGNQNIVGRGGGQKAHILSPLDFRLSTYLMAMFNFDYKLIAYLNEFHDLNKARYLSYKDMSHSLRIRRVRYTEFKEFKPIYIQNFPDYSSDDDLDLNLHLLRCMPCSECNK